MPRGGALHLRSRGRPASAACRAPIYAARPPQRCAPPARHRALGTTRSTPRRRRRRCIERAVELDVLARRGDAPGRRERRRRVSRRPPASARRRCSTTPRRRATPGRLPRAPRGARAARAPLPVRRRARAAGGAAARRVRRASARACSTAPRRPAGALLLDGAVPGGDATMTDRPQRALAVLGAGRRARRWRSWSTTRTGPTGRRWRCSPTSRGGSTTCRC